MYKSYCSFEIYHYVSRYAWKHEESQGIRWNKKNKMKYFAYNSGSEKNKIFTVYYIFILSESVPIVE